MAKSRKKRKVTRGEPNKVHVKALQDEIRDILDVSDDSKHKKVKTYDVKLTTDELIHLRDLFSILLPPDASKTLSQALAQAERRSMIEAKLWDKLNKLCAKAGVPLGDEAPDYAVAPMSPPTLGIFPLNVQNHEDQEEEEED